MACPDCGLFQNLGRMGPREVAVCARCGATLHRFGSTDSAPLALALAGLCCAVVANAAPLITVRMGGQHLFNLLATGPRKLADQDYTVLGILVALFTIIVPILWLVGVAYVLTCIELGHRPPELALVFKTTERLEPWAMSDVFVLGGFVAFTRVQDLGDVVVGTGGWAVIALAFCTLLVQATLDHRRIWEEIAPESPLAAASRAAWIACPQCDLVTARQPGAPCPRCKTPLRARKPNSLARTGALVLTGLALYFPANFLPIMAVGRLGTPRASTIVSGIGELIQLGLWPLAVVVLFASILVPVLKLVSLTWFLVAIRFRSRWRLVERTRLYRLVDAIGRWSNIDVFMISILVALVRFGVIASVEPKAGAVAFAAVVVLTMVAAQTFDPRLMWDAAEGGA